MMTTTTEKSLEGEPGEPEAQRGFDRIPAHWRYPGMVVVLLVSSATAQMVLLSAALSGGGAQIERDYYEKAVDWDAAQERARVGEELGWLMSTERSEDESTLLVVVEDGQRRGVEGLHGEVVLRRPHLSEPVWRGALSEHEERGVGRFAIRLPGEHVRGVWDVLLVLRAGASEEEVVRTLRSAPDGKDDERGQR